LSGANSGLKNVLFTKPAPFLKVAPVFVLFLSLSVLFASGSVLFAHVPVCRAGLVFPIRNTKTGRQARGEVAVAFWWSGGLRVESVVIEFFWLLFLG
jgi:hypothetical protein